MFLTLVYFFLFSHADPETNYEQCSTSNKQVVENKKLWEHPQWIRLLHLYEGVFSPKSEADGGSFFASSKSSTPKEELIATVTALCKNEDLKTSSKNIPSLKPRCQFPAREEFFIQSGLSGWAKPECPDLEDWKTRVGKERAYMVFSSYYAQNPSSVFGHTLLRFDKIKPGTKSIYNPLLSYGINFAGNPTTENAMLYAILGMVGGFPGTYTSLPYYYKVREYSDFDSRDLWEYELNLNTAQINTLLNHIWEQGFTHYDYYYFSENCSYHLLSSLSLVAPEQNLLSKVPPYVIPIDTVKALSLKSPSLISGVHFRPSLYRQFHERLNILKNKNLDSHFHKYLTNGLAATETLTAQDKAYVLDTILDYWDFKNAKELLEPQSEASKIKFDYLQLRAKLPNTEPLVLKPEDFERPDVSHETLRLGISYIDDESLGSGAEVDLRFALHDFLDMQTGYPKISRIEFFRFIGNYFTDTRGFKIEQLKFFDIQLLAPLTKIEKTISWRALVGANRTQFNCDNCMTGQLQLQGGATLGFNNDDILLYSLLGLDTRYSPEGLNHHWLAIPLSSTGIVWRLPKHIALQTEYNYQWASVMNHLEDAHDITAELRYSFKMNYAIGANYKKEFFKSHDNDQAKLNFYYYF
jgi:hypothetical protein